jgi:hypothetical protein
MIGYWVDISSYKYAGDLYKCSRDTCFIASLQNTTSNCWKYTHFDSTNASLFYCNSDQLQCSRGAGGPLCGSCLDGYLFQSVANTCQECGHVQLVSYVALACVVFVVLAIVIYFAHGDRFGVYDWELVRWLLNIDRGSLKVLWVTYQIIMSVTWNLDIQVSFVSIYLSVFF